MVELDRQAETRPIEIHLRADAMTGRTRQGAKGDTTGSVLPARLDEDGRRSARGRGPLDQGVRPAIKYVGVAKSTRLEPLTPTESHSNPRRATLSDRRKVQQEVDEKEAGACRRTGRGQVHVEDFAIAQEMKKLGSLAASSVCPDGPAGGMRMNPEMTEEMGTSSADRAIITP